jgi:hypothetical protein
VKSTTSAHAACLRNSLSAMALTKALHSNHCHSGGKSNLVMHTSAAAKEQRTHRFATVLIIIKLIGEKSQTSQSTKHFTIFILFYSS